MTDVFRKVYRNISTNNSMAIEEIKNLAEKIYYIYDHQKVSDANEDLEVDGADKRNMALAKTKLEESVM